MFRETKPGYNEVMELVQSLSALRPPIAEIEQRIRQLYAAHKTQHIAESADAGIDKEEALRTDPWKGLYPYKRAEYRDNSGRFLTEEEAVTNEVSEIWVWREVEPSMPAGKQATSIRDPDSENYRFYEPIHPISGEPCKAPKRGWAFPFSAIGQRPSFVRYLQDSRISFKESHDSIPQQKYFLHEVDSVVATSVVRQYADGEPRLEALFGAKGLIDNPKPPGLVERFVRQTTEDGDFVADFFAGSGTSGHAVVNSNREDGKQRRFLLVEQAGYFDTVLVPRIKKIVFSPAWEAGRVTRLASDLEVQRGPKVLQIVRLESYEDALNNLLFQRSSDQQAILEFDVGPILGVVREQYLLRYQLDVESKGSASLLNVRAFGDPTAYRLKVKTPGSDESREVNVDLLETFNWLLGLTVQQITAPRSFHAEFERDVEGRLQLKGRLRQSDDGPFWFRTVTGTTPEGRKTLVIWRKLTGEPEQDNLVLEEWFKNKQAYSVRDAEFDLIYVNGDNTLENLRVDPETWKVRLIEEDFHRLMFEGTEA